MGRELWGEAARTPTEPHTSVHVPAAAGRSPFRVTDRFLDCAIITGRRIASQAVWSGGACTWEVVGSRAGEGPRPEIVRVPAGANLYQGTAGIGLFLAELARLSGDAGLRKVSEGAIRHALAQPATAFRTRMGWWDGALGSAWGAVRAGEALGSEELVERGIAAAAALAREAAPDGETDVMVGAAGAVPLLLDLGARPGGEACAEAAAALGDWLLEAAVPEVWGWSWPSPGIPGLRNLLGFAHGASGPAHALLALFAATGDVRVAEGARQGLAYERRFHDRARGGWPDFRPGLTARFGAAPSGSGSWCTGAAGIGLVRARAWRLLGGEELRAEVHAAVRGVRARLEQPWDDVSLCHGTMGAADFLLVAADALGEPAPRALAMELGARAAEQCASGGWPCGTADRSPDPSLMLGEAGIGHAFLRLSCPGVESLLLPPLSAVPAAPAAPSLPPRILSRGVRKHFGRSLDALGALLPAARSEVEAECAAAPDGEEVLRVRRALGRLAATPGSLAADLVRLDTERFAVALDPFAEPFPPPVRGAPRWEEAWIEPAPGVRVVVSERDWDAWLELSPGERGDEPAPGPVFHLLQRAGSEVRVVRLLPFAGLAFRAVEGGARLDRAAERVREALAGDAPPVEALREPLKKQLQQLHARGAVRASAWDPVERAVVELGHRMDAPAGMPPAQVAAAVIRRVLEAGPEELAREDATYARLRMESDAARARQALRTLYLEGFFRDLLDRVETAPPEERRGACEALLEELRLVAGSPLAPLAVEL